MENSSECLCAQSLQSCLTLFNPINCSPPGSSVHRILQARILEWVAISSSRGSAWPRDWTYVFGLAGGFFITELPGKPFKGVNLILYHNWYKNEFLTYSVLRISPQKCFKLPVPFFSLPSFFPGPLYNTGPQVHSVTLSSLRLLFPLAYSYSTQWHIHTLWLPQGLQVPKVCLDNRSHCCLLF